MPRLMLRCSPTSRASKRVVPPHPRPFFWREDALKAIYRQPFGPCHQPRLSPHTREGIPHRLSMQPPGASHESTSGCSTVLRSRWAWRQQAAWAHAARAAFFAARGAASRARCQTAAEAQALAAARVAVSSTRKL